MPIVRCRTVQVVEPSGASAVDLSTIQPEDVVLLCDDDDWYHRSLWRGSKHWVNGHHPPVPPRYQWATTYIERVRSVFPRGLYPEASTAALQAQSGKSMACYVIVRQTLDWERATPDDLFDRFARETARTWARTFDTSYFACRARIKAIARENLKNLQLLDGDAQVHDAATFPFFALRPDDVVLPYDDDDWYHPEVIQRVAAAGPLRGGLLMWPDAVYGYHGGRFHLERPCLRQLDDRSAVSGPVKTNNYAFSGRLAQERRAVWGHASIKRYVRETRPAFSRLDRPLSAGQPAPVQLHRLEVRVAGHQAHGGGRRSAVSRPALHLMRGG